ncbi:MAG: dihydrolipoyl dehydrogenase [Desulfobacterales bacterium]|nr:dihydrolipoyl dehydrogenase [Deltaproteobacteria bacterium]NNK93152.1 dihydrolipoyl dehydrogenase [Desulfobacterales bacterium]
MGQTISVDVAVIGGGPGGYTAAFRAADLGLSVCLIEKADRLGGVCLNVGCIPSKTLLHVATMIEEAENASEFGITFTAPEINLDSVREKKDGIIKQLTGGLDGLCKARKVNRLVGTASFATKATLSIKGDEGEKIVSFKNAIIASGSRPFVLPGIPDDSRIWDSTDALRLDTIPKKLLIIGGGIIGLEMAQVYSALGSQITVVEMLKQLIPPADKDLVQPLFLKLKKRYQIYTDTKVTSVETDKTGITVSFDGPQKIETAKYDGVLVAVGRRPNSEELELGNVGIVPSERGFIEVDEKQQTSEPHIFAIGDVVGEPMLAHKATHQAKVAAEVIAGHKAAFTPLTIPSVAYTNPEIAWMGITEKEAKEQGIPYEKGKFSWGASGRALASGATTGASKALFDKENGRLIGAGICGVSAGEIIHEAILALEMGADAEDISKTIHAHPTLAETFAFAAEMVDGSITDAMPPKKK